MDICSSVVGAPKNTTLLIKWVAVFLGTLIAFTFPISSHALTSSTGKTAVLAGDFSVSGGEATYSLPISVSPGRAGHQPSLSLEYRSDSPNGNLGMGWSIGGLSAITRCGKNLATDGRWGGVQFNTDDRYCLDGKRLIAITGKDGGHTTEYRLKENGYSKIISFGTAGSGPAYFKVWTKDGSVYEYGVTGDSRAELPGQAHVYKWALNKITDVTGNNSISFYYAENQTIGSHKIVSIDYIGGEILFGYGSRSDVTTSYLNGSSLIRNERLTSITTRDSANTVIGIYSPSYIYSSGTSRSLINGLNYCTNESCSTPIDFNWRFQKTASYTQTTSDLIQPRYIDSDRDGKLSSYGIVKRTKGLETCGDDIGPSHLNTVKHPSGHTTENNDDSFTLIGSIDSPSLSIQKWETTGRQHCQEEGEMHLSAVATPKDLCVEGNYSPSSDGVLSAYCKNNVAGDFNGDGKETIKQSFIKPSFTIDLNNDGIDDYAYKRAPNAFVYQLSGAGNDVKLEVASPVGLGYDVNINVVDINNDGLPDVVSYNPYPNQLRIYLNNGKGFLHTQTLSIHNNAIFETGELDFVDINNDGYPEYFKDGNFYKNNFGSIDASNIVKTIPLDNINSRHKNYSVNFPDINGDGWADTVITSAFRESSNYQTGAVTPNAIQHISSGGIQDKIYKIQESGVDYTINYKFATDASVHKQIHHFAYPYLNTTPRRFLVSNYSKAPKGYSPTSYSYFYEGARSHAKGYGFLGFQKITRTENAAIKTVISTTYEVNDGIIAGKPLSIIETRNGKKVGEQTFNYKKVARQGYGGQYYQIYANSITNIAYDLATQAVKRKELTTRTLDHFGNVVNEATDITSGIAKGGHFTTNTINQYLSSGVNSDHQIYDITSIQNIDNFESTLASFKAGLGRYCGSDGKIYFKPNDHIVLIHGEIDTPIVLQRYNSYYLYSTTGSSTDLDGLTTISGALTGITASAFNAASPASCGSYAYSDYDGDGQSEFATTKSTRTQLVTEAAENFWKIGALNVSTTTIADEDSNLIRTVENSFNYDGKGLLQANTTRASEYGTSSSISSAKYLTNAFKYDAYGNVIETKLTGSNIDHARISTSTYDANSLFPKTQTNAKGHTTTFTYDNNGLLKQSKSPLAGRTVSYNYDAFQRLTSETRPGSNNTISHNYKLDTACFAATPRTASCAQTSAANRGTVITHFDYAGHEIRSLHQGFNGEWIVRDNNWDRSGRKVSATRPRFLNDTAISVVNFQYDELHRETHKDEPAAKGGRARFKTAYTGFVTSLTDARGFNHSTTQNVLGHILRKDEPDSAFQTYAYYPDGKLKETTDSSGNVTKIGYDSLGHRSSLDDPDMGYWEYTYNALGELKVKKDANGVKTTLAYDALGRKTAEQYNTGGTMKWVYDTRGKPGTLAAVIGNELRTDYYYNGNGLLEEVAKQTNGEKFSSHYFYDDYERVNREVRPNGIDTSRLAGANNLSKTENPDDRLVLEYVYNPNGYMSAVRSPKNYADEVFTSASFRDEIRQLLTQAIQLANTYLERAEKYAIQEGFFKSKAAEYNQKTVNVHTLDGSSAAMLAGGYRYKQWCNAQGECYLRPGTWVLLHDDVVTPIDVTLDGDIYRVESTLVGNSAGKRNYSTTVHKVSDAEFGSQALYAAHDFILTDYDKNGQLDLMSTNDIYIAKADTATQEELLFTAEDLDQAAAIAGSRYKFYTELAGG
ncbi:type IV secretion protein Rhs, partial [Enterovibrio norvegicus FF-33]|uniref:FG-GAP-like repeat-containing protein n=1 Tax=Enterovibrio norvegicus TaxID=188144 RepID=UPI000370A5F0